MYEKLQEIFKSFQEFMSNNPEYGYLIGVGGFVLLLLGVVFDWDWVVMPDSGSRRWFHRFMMENFGRKATRIWLGIIFGLAITACLLGFYLTPKKTVKSDNYNQKEISTKYT